MKKNNLLKVIAITCLVFLVLTWIIPTGSYSNATYTKDSITALGVGDLFIYSFHSVYLSIAIISMVVILLIGGLYGVLNKNYQKEKYRNDSALKYYNNGKEVHILHDDTRALLELLLEMVALKGEKETNHFIKYELLKGKIPYEKEWLQEYLRKMKQ